MSKKPITIDKHAAAAIASLTSVAQGITAEIDKWDAVILMLYIDHLQGEAQRWADMYNREALRFASIRNSHDALVDACDGIEAVYAEYLALRPNGASPSFDLVTQAVRQARAALAAAKGA